MVWVLGRGRVWAMCVWWGDVCKAATGLRSATRTQMFSPHSTEHNCDPWLFCILLRHSLPNLFARHFVCQTEKTTQEASEPQFHSQSLPKLSEHPPPRPNDLSTREVASTCP